MPDTKKNEQFSLEFMKDIAKFCQNKIYGPNSKAVIQEDAVQKQTMESWQK